jgi:hypothetical protein
MHSGDEASKESRTTLAGRGAQQDRRGHETE